MIFKAVISNRANPDRDQVTILFPIPDSEYDRTIGLLEDMDIGSPTAQDCRVDGLESTYPILNRLVTQTVNVDELDYLAKRLDSFCPGEKERFQAVASKLHLSNIKDFINLTFGWQQATVITDFSDLECIGKDHALAVNGGGMPVDAFEKVDGLSVALDLIQSGAGTVTPYGVVYSNGMELEQVYNGRHFPAFYYEDCMAAVALSLPGQDGQEMLYFPCPDSKIARAVKRLGVSSPAGCEAVLDDTDICDAILGLFEAESQLNEHLDALNRLTRCYQGFQDDNLEKFHTVFEHARPQTLEESVYLAENLDQFDFVPKSGSPEADSAITGLGPVAYHGSVTLEELMRDNPEEQHQREMGGMK